MTLWLHLFFKMPDNSAFTGVGNGIPKSPKGYVFSFLYFTVKVCEKRKKEKGKKKKFGVSNIILQNSTVTPHAKNPKRTVNNAIC